MTELTLLRPWWLLTLIPSVWLLWLVWQRKVQDSGWKQWIDPAFQPYLLSQHTNSKKSWPIGFMGLTVIWLATVIALSGPSWKQQPIAAQATQTGSVIVLDLSLSMYADDLQPNRLTRVQFKLTDLLKHHPEMRVGMVGYSASAHTITPISDDNSTLLNLLPHLNPLIMPSYGANAVAGFTKAIELFQGANTTQRHIIWVTDDIEPAESAPIRQLLEQHNVKLSVLAVGTPQGGAIMIPDFGLLKDQEDRLVQAQVPLQRLADLSRDVGGQFSRMQFDDSDLPSLTPPFGAATERQQDDEQNLFQALDYGVYLLWLLVPLAALAVRRGWLLSLGLVALLPGLLIAPPSFADTEHTQKPEIKLSERWREQFLTGNQRGYQAWLEQDYLTAEREFKDSSWRGSSLYRQGRYEEAAHAFARDDSAQGHYNRGNALARSGELEPAREAYQTALERQPDFTQAQHNLDVVEELLALQQDPDSPSQDDSLPPQPQQNQQGEDQQSDQGEANEQPAEQTPQSGEQGQQGDTEQDGQTDGLNQREETPSEPSDEETAESQAREQQQTEAESDAEQDGQTGLLNEPTEAELAEQQAQAREQAQAQQTWLNQIKDEPGVFLRRKFDYQYQQQGGVSRQNAPDNTQKDQSKLW